VKDLVGDDIDPILHVFGEAEAGEGYAEVAAEEVAEGGA
jgi:hypothetical protein